MPRKLFTHRTRGTLILGDKRGVATVPINYGHGRSPLRPDLTGAGCSNLTLAGHSPTSLPGIILVARPDLTLYPPKLILTLATRPDLTLAAQSVNPPRSRIFPLIPSQTDFTSAGQSPDSPPDRYCTRGPIPDSLYR